MAELDPETSIRLESSHLDGAPMLSISGELDLSTVERIRAAVEASLATKPERVVFDLHGLRFMDSSGIALLLSIAERVSSVELRNPSSIIRQLIDMTGLGDTLRVVE